MTLEHGIPQASHPEEFWMATATIQLAHIRVDVLEPSIATESNCSFPHGSHEAAGPLGEIRAFACRACGTMNLRVLSLSPLRKAT